jgi:hypothetical protein
MHAARLLRKRTKVTLEQQLRYFAVEKRVFFPLVSAQELLALKTVVRALHIHHD